MGSDNYLGNYQNNPQQTSNQTQKVLFYTGWKYGASIRLMFVIIQYSWFNDEAIFGGCFILGL